jgi:hypothetical protein
MFYFLLTSLHQKLTWQFISNELLNTNFNIKTRLRYMHFSLPNYI